MLYDPKWETKIKPDVYALSTLVSWLEKQPPEERYDWMNCRGRCLLGRYMAAHDIEWFGPGTPYSDFVEAGKAATGKDWQDIAIGEPRTFAAALERARAML